MSNDEKFLFPQVALTNYKIVFTFTEKDGTKNGGMCSHPRAIPEIFDHVNKIHGRDLVFKDETVYFQPKNQEELDQAVICSERFAKLGI